MGASDLEMTNDEYKKYADRHAPRSPLWPDIARAFLVGGLICCLGQLLGNLYGAAGLAREDAVTVSSITLVFLSALLTGLGVSALPTLWFLRRWNSAPRASSPAWQPRCSSSPGP